ncbi:hypothetical protein OG735_00755 [Streptomyces sp. NBC_01210]|uniref:hypothetical protein n=1 Tax=Streptomyces sp. NBC_01210 TaxID=2903774 RepID=UPI002E14AA44|nr:hypothetical protein OG735_00755 [Streptomyces sp. NBC_01210]
MEFEDPELMVDAFAIVGAFNMADMQRSRRALLFWLHPGELDGRTGRRMRASAGQWPRERDRPRGARWNSAGQWPRERDR